MGAMRGSTDLGEAPDCGAQMSGDCEGLARAE